MEKFTVVLLKCHLALCCLIGVIGSFLYIFYEHIKILLTVKSQRPDRLFVVINETYVNINNAPSCKHSKKGIELMPGKNYLLILQGLTGYTNA